MNASIIAHSRTFLPGAVRRAWRSLLARVGSDCPACGGLSRGGLLCAPCVQDARWPLRHGAPRCPRCALALPAGPCPQCLARPPAFGRVVAGIDYAAPFDTLVVRFKGGRHVLAGALAGLMHEAADDAWPGARPPLDLLVPVPASRASLRERGFNPAGELAAALAHRLDIPLARGALRRRREEDGRQARRGRLARISAARGLYACAQPMYGLRVGLVDDVLTTGSTADAAARALLAAGAVEVTVLVAARTP